MNTPKSGAPKRYTPSRAMFGKGRLRGSFYYGIPDDFGEVVGHVVVQWAHLEEEMIAVMASLLGDINTSPARQVFRSLTSEQARLKVMRSLLHEAKSNISKSKYYDEVIDEFASLNKIRNSYVHGLWYTHSTGKVLIAEVRSDEESTFDRKKPISLNQVKHTLRRIIELSRTVGLQTRAEHAESSPKKPAQPPNLGGS
jgi:hypothetical protein